MDKRNLKKTEQPDRKQEKKDRGDLKKEKQVKKMADSDTNDIKVPPDRGDLKKAEKQGKKADSDVKLHADRGDLKKTEKQAKKNVDSDTNEPKFYLHSDKEEFDRKIIKIDKPKLNVIIKKSDDKAKNIEHRTSRENIKKLDIETLKTVPDDRRKIREKYNMKYKVPSIVNPNVYKKEEQLKLRNYFKPVITDNKNDRTPKKADPAKDKSDELNESKQSVSIINILKSEKKDLIQRKPIIRTISSKNDRTKIYKAVTFVDQKKNKPTTLQIKIPNDIGKNPKNLKSTETMTVKKIKPTLSRVSVKEKPRKKTQRKKGDRKNRHVASPNLSLKIRSPPTEVAKWAPSSINRHTKPYYEAWVSTTLAAISKNSKKDKLFLEKQNILQNFQRALSERPETPELVYENFTDERYTGKIKVKQR